MKQPIMNFIWLIILNSNLIVEKQVTINFTPTSQPENTIYFRLSTASSASDDTNIINNRFFYGYHFTINDTSIKEQTGLNTSNIISIIYINPYHKYGSSGYKYILSSWSVHDSKLYISMLC